MTLPSLPFSFNLNRKYTKAKSFYSKLERREDMKMQMQRDHPKMMTRIPNPDLQVDDIINSVCKSWKLYDNPSYFSSQSQEHQNQNQQQRKAFIWDLNFIKVFMESELEKARGQILELKTELDYERKARRRAESMSKRLIKDMEEERKGRETEEKKYKQLIKEISSEKSEIIRMKREVEEERQMHKLAEVLREERVQMKLADARLFLEEKLSELEGSNKGIEVENREESKPKKLERMYSSPAYLNRSKKEKEQRTEAENPHIKRGIKGFVEFPRVMRAIRSKGEQWGSKLECQKVQLKILLRQKTTPRCVNAFVSSA